MAPLSARDRLQRDSLHIYHYIDCMHNVCALLSICIYDTEMRTIRTPTYARWGKTNMERQVLLFTPRSTSKTTRDPEFGRKLVCLNRAGNRLTLPFTHTHIQKQIGKAPLGE